MKWVKLYSRAFMGPHELKYFAYYNALCANFIKWSNTLKQFVRNLPTNCLRMFDHFVGLALKGITIMFSLLYQNILPQLTTVQNM